jgi:hypothetical protein
LKTIDNVVNCLKRLQTSHTSTTSHIGTTVTSDQPSPQGLWVFKTHSSAYFGTFLGP